METFDEGRAKDRLLVHRVVQCQVMVQLCQHLLGLELLSEVPADDRGQLFADRCLNVHLDLISEVPEECR